MKIDTTTLEQEIDILQRMYKSFQVNLAEVQRRLGNVHTNTSGESTITKDGGNLEVVYSNQDKLYVLVTRLASVFYKGKKDKLHVGWIPLMSLLDREPENIQGSQTQDNGIVQTHGNPQITRNYSITDRRFLQTLVEKTKSTSLESMRRRSLMLPDGETYWVDTTFYHSNSGPGKPTKIESYWKNPFTGDEFFLTSDTYDVEESQLGLFEVEKGTFKVTKDINYNPIKAVAYQNGGQPLQVGNQEEQRNFLDGVIEACTAINVLRKKGIEIRSS
jgi:hypothetical protein